MSELKHHLRKQEFPVSAREALLRLEKLCLSTSQQQQRLIQEVIEEFVFCEMDRRGIRKKRLNAVQELQLLDVLTIYFETRESEVVRNTMFLTLFHCEGIASNKMKMLAKLVSSAIAIRSAAVLDCSAVWMQQQGCTSTVVVGLAQELIRDYLMLFPKALFCLEELPQISLAFTSHFITAATTAQRRKPSSSLPSLPLLRCITQWVSSNPLLCSTPLVSNLQNCLPKGSIVMPTGVPLPGLIRWCVEAPLLDYKSEGIASESEEQERRSLYSQLHLAVLETMIETEKLHDRMVQKDVLVTRDFIGICECVAHIVQNLDFVQCQEGIQLSLDRLGQALQVSLRTGCLRGNIGELHSYLMRLPQNRLLEIVLSQGKLVN